jgi:hypothetical protein
VNHDGICKGCAQGKSMKILFPRSDNKAKGVFEIMHRYVCGLMSTTSLRGYIYYVSFIDDFSRKTLIYFLKNKVKYSTSSRNSKPL